jgi:arylformamidase
MSLDWESQFNPRKAVPDSETFTARAQILSDRAYQNLAAIQELHYGNGPLMNLDFRAATSPGRPLLVYVHGGYWRARDKRNFGYIFEAFAAADVNVALLNYDLCPQVTVEHICREIQAAFIWLCQQAKTLGFDPAQIHACGHSAGAHVLAMALAQGTSCASLPDGMIRHAYLVSGIYELSPVLNITVNAEVQLQPEDVAKLSPVRFPASRQTHYHVIVGGAEPEGWIEQSRHFAQHVQAQGAPVKLTTLENRHHFSILEDLQTSDAALTRMICEHC